MDGTTASQRAGAPAYDRVAVALHWLIGAALLAQITFGLLLDDIAPRGTPARTTVVNLHKSCGIVLGLLIVVRLGWRLAHRPPPWPRSMSARQQAAARWGHRALYACMLAVPLAGYLASNFSKYGIRFFGTPWPAWGPPSPAIYGVLNTLHEAGAWALMALVVGHVALALKHALIDHDGVFRRIWPQRHPETLR